jgi:hypothetical protein
MTAVEWLWEQIDGIIPYQDINTSQLFIGLLEQAKEMEKQQMQDFGARCCLMTKQKHEWTLEQLYNETYGSKGSDENFKQFSLYEHKETIATSDTPISSQTEISDEEIEKAAIEYYESAVGNLDREIGFRYACKWYREQLKKK